MALCVMTTAFLARTVCSQTMTNNSGASTSLTPQYPIAIFILFQHYLSLSPSHCTTIKPLYTSELSDF